MKRTALKRTAGPARKARLTPRRATPRRSSRVEDRGYMGAVHGLPCCAEDLSPCFGRIEADHAGKKSGMGMKSSDLDCVPMCSRHHQQRHDFHGPFKSWTAPQMRAWLDAQIADTRAAIAAAASLNTTAPSADHRRA